MKIKINVDSKGYADKPRGAEVGGIRNRLGQEKSIKEIQPNALIDLIETGRSWTPAAMSGTRSESFKSQQVFSVDVDNDSDEKLTVDKALEECERLGISPYCIYETFGNTEQHPRFRIIWISNEPIYDMQKALSITKGLWKVFDGLLPGCSDSTMVDAARLLFGGRMGCVVYKGGNITDVASLLELSADTKHYGESEQKKNADEAESGLRYMLQNDSCEWVEAWVKKHGVDVTETARAGSSFIYGVHCPWSASHSADTGRRQSAIIVRADGQIGYKCQHEHCKTKTWKDYRAYYDNSKKERKPRRFDAGESLEPSDYTDLGEANVLVRVYGQYMRYAKSIGFLCYSGVKWEEGGLSAQQFAQELTSNQLAEARTRVSLARDEQDALIEDGAAKEDISAAKEKIKSAEKYRAFVLMRRASSRLSAALTEAAPMIQVNMNELDSDGLLLNTPDGTIDLRNGEIHQHRAEELHTKVTAVAPSIEGKSKFDSFLQQLTCNDHALERYLQDIAGLFCIGDVKVEALFIAAGCGGNGKSTFFNLLFRVLGDYSGMLSAEVLTTNSRKNKSPEYAELRGKRLIIAAELEEGQRLDAATVKKLCSTDPVYAEKKFKDPFYFEPSHHIVLYTNYKPRVGSNDAGTWDRLIVIPFNASFRGKKDEVKDYASELFDECGGAVLSWMVEGARRVISQNYIIDKPQCVIDMIDEYRKENDWLAEFLETTCQIGKSFTVGSGELYQAYRSFCEHTGEYTRNAKDFNAALLAASFEKHKTKHGVVWRGLRAKTFAEIQHDEILARDSIG